MKRLGIAIILTVIVNNLFGQQDLVVGSSYQLSLQRQNGHGDAWILHNAEYSQDLDLLKWKTTHSSFGARGIRFNYSSGIYFYADNNSTVSGTNFNPTTRFFIGNNGNVGIGTTTPTNILDVNGQSRFRGNIELETLKEFWGNVYYNGGYKYRANGYGFRFYQTSVGTIGIGIAPSGIADATPTFTNHMNITADGNVGIGTTTPFSKLHVGIDGSQFLIGTIGSGRGAAIGSKVTQPGSSGSVNEYAGYWAYDAYYDESTSTWKSMRTSLGRKWKMEAGYHLDDLRFSYSSSGDPIAWSDLFSIKSSGRVGIGTTTPSSLLHLNGRNEFRIGTDNTGSEYFSISKFDGGVTISSYEDPTDANNGHGRIMFLNNGSKTTGLNNGGFIFKHTDGTVFLDIRNDGNVGIGTTSPQYKLSVKGTIGCGEVKVEDVGTWADFVFHPTYKLRTLGEVEQFIKANNHLPEIPTESEVKQNGIGLGEMNAKLLQKIEELTLYMIEQNNKMDQQQKQINELKELNNVLVKEVQNIKK